MKVKPMCRTILVYLVISFFVSGCYFEQGKLYFDELGLDPITVYKMAPLERTIYCLAALGEDMRDNAYDQMFVRALADIETNPEEADWSELVCLTLADQAAPKDIKRTLNTIALILAVQPMKNHPARGFKKIMEQRLEFFAEIERLEEERRVDREAAAAEVSKYQKIIANQKEAQNLLENKNKELEIQVRKLKEVELILHPKQ